MAVSAHAAALAVKELRQVLRGPVAMVLQIAYLLLVGLIAALMVLDSSGEWRPAWEHGSTAFWAIVYTQAVLVLVIGVSLTAASVTMEHEQKTYDTLLTTPLSPWEIAGGKLLGGLSVGGSIILLSTPVLAACLLLGGVPLATALWAEVLLLTALLLAAALGLYCSALARRTVAAVPLAIVAGVATAAIFAPFSSLVPGLAAFSPLVALRLLSTGQAVPLLGWAAPVWAVCLLAWLLLTAVLMLSAADLLKHPPLQRRLAVRLTLAVLAALLLALVVTALNLGQTETAEEVGERLQGFTLGGSYLLLGLAAVFAAGALTPLDRRRLLRQPLAAYSPAERLLGYSLWGGGRFVMLLLLLMAAVLECGLLLSGRPLLSPWGGRVLLALLPALAALWCYTILARLPAYGRWPRTLAGRQLLALVLTVVLMLLPLVPSMVSAAAKEPPALAELFEALSPGGGLAAAFPTAEKPFASSLVSDLAEAAPIPLLSAGIHLLLGGLLTLLEFVLIRRWRVRNTRQ